MLAQIRHINRPISAPTVSFCTSAKKQIIRESKVVGKGVSWQTFQALLTDVGDACAWRIACDNRVLEIRRPYQEQEFPIIILAYFANAIADELEIEAMQLGARLLEKEELQRAIGPDTCFYIQHQALVISKVAESESFIIITGISANRTFLFEC